MRQTKFTTKIDKFSGLVLGAIKSSTYVIANQFPRFYKFGIKHFTQRKNLLQISKVICYRSPTFAIGSVRTKEGQTER
jgi:hypothetical protein